jgi:hypothetical protein
MHYLMRAAAVALSLAAIGSVASCATAGTQQSANHSAPSQQDPNPCICWWTGLD